VPDSLHIRTYLCILTWSLRGLPNYESPGNSFELTMPPQPDGSAPAPARRSRL